MVIHQMSAITPSVEIHNALKRGDQMMATVLTTFSTAVLRIN